MLWLIDYLLFKMFSETIAAVVIVLKVADIAFSKEAAAVENKFTTVTRTMTVPILLNIKFLLAISLLDY